MNIILQAVLAVLFLLSFLVQLYFTLFIHRKLGWYKNKKSDEKPNHSVSVIICAKNELENLKINLPLILNQNYSDFEVILVNDCSSDQSDIYLRELSQGHPHLKVVTIEEHQRFKHGKKFAVTLGIKAAKNEYLLFTDADCKPDSVNWISIMQQNFVNDISMVIGFSPYKIYEGLLNKVIRYETFFTALNYLSFALAGNPYMGVGRNMAYKRSLFFENKGFASHMHIPSGDDDLFVNQNATSENTAIEIDQDSFIESEPKLSWKDYYKQKIRHMGAGKMYKPRHKRILTLQALSAMLFYTLFIFFIAISKQWWIFLIFFIIRYLTQSIIYYAVLKRLKYKDLVWWFLVLDLIYYFYMLFLSTHILFKKKVQWK